MWRFYLKSNEGVAILSTSKRLQKCLSTAWNRLQERLPGACEVKVSKVVYLNYDQGSLTDFSGQSGGFDPFTAPFMSKRKGFEHERELRAIFSDSATLKNWDSQNATWKKNAPFDRGHPIELNLDELIDGILVSPYSADWFYELVRSVTKKYKVDKKVKVIRSNMAKEPLW